nr:immunoglobulin light chain junction region [Macaca mulatta]
CLQDTHLPPTF